MLSGERGDGGGFRVDGGGFVPSRSARVVGEPNASPIEPEPRLSASSRDAASSKTSAVLDLVGVGASCVAAGHGESDDLPARLSAASIALQARLATARGVCSRARASAASSAAFSARTRLSLAILRRVVSRHASAHLATVLALQWQSAHHSATASSPYRDRPPFVESRNGDAALSPRSTDVRVATASLSLALTRFNRSSADSSSSNSPSFNSSRVIVANGSSWRAPGSISATIGVRRSMRSPGDSARRSSAACDDATKGENGIHRGECDGFVSVAANVVDVGTIGARLAEAALVFEAARTVSSPNLSLREAAAHCSTSRSSANPRAADSGRVVVGAGGPNWEIAAAPGPAGPSALGLAGAGDMTRTVAS
mmetsp:Transcript_10215/g.39902  ORF Transcript_10215/g.39902 Transcript_10215/m.39902 type:complete len:369 (-) Transcript_10215:69-1175(-)